MDAKVLAHFLSTYPKKGIHAAFFHATFALGRRLNTANTIDDTKTLHFDRAYFLGFPGALWVLPNTGFVANPLQQPHCLTIRDGAQFHLRQYDRRRHFERGGWEQRLAIQLDAERTGHQRDF